MTADVATFVHDYLRAPSGGDAVTFLLLHGTGGSEHDLLHLGPMLDEGAGLLAPRGQVLEDGQPRFFRRLAQGVFDLDDLRARTHGLAVWVRAAARHYGFDARRIVAVGDRGESRVGLAPRLSRAT